jgi:hypothetical protein
MVSQSNSESEIRVQSSVACADESPRTPPHSCSHIAHGTPCGMASLPAAIIATLADGTRHVLGLECDCASGESSASSCSVSMGALDPYRIDGRGLE